MNTFYDQEQLPILETLVLFFGDMEVYIVIGMIVEVANVTFALTTLDYRILTNGSSY